MHFHMSNKEAAVTAMSSVFMYLQQFCMQIVPSLGSDL